MVWSHSWQSWLTDNPWESNFRTQGCSPVKLFSIIDSKQRDTDSIITFTVEAVLKKFMRIWDNRVVLCWRTIWNADNFDINATFVIGWAFDGLCRFYCDVYSSHVLWPALYKTAYILHLNLNQTESFHRWDWQEW